MQSCMIEIHKVNIRMIVSFIRCPEMYTVTTAYRLARTAIHLSKKNKEEKEPSVLVQHYDAVSISVSLLPH